MTINATDITMRIGPGGTLEHDGGITGTGDMGILLLGDSNMTGSNSNSDSKSNTIYEWVNSAVSEVTNNPPNIYHTPNNNTGGTGPDVQFCDGFAGDNTGQRTVAIGAGLFGASQTNYGIGNSLYNNAQSYVNAFLAANSNNTLRAVLVQLGSNDGLTGFQTFIDGLIASIQGDMFTGNASQSTFSNLPVIICGHAPDYYDDASDRQDIQDILEGIPARLNYTAYASSLGLSSEGADAVHFSAAGAVTLGQRAYAVLSDAQGNR